MDLDQVRSEMVADLGEVNMADGASLVDFATWAIESFPADHYALILSDHGMGWPGGWSDPAPGGKDDSRAPIASALDDHLYLMELDEALGEIRSRAGLEKLDLIGMDACLMGSLEVFSALEPHARYAVASQETEPALGWAYTGFLSALAEDPGMSAEQLSRQVVETYIQDDQRIVDDQARAEFLRRGSPLGGLLGSFGAPSAAQLAQQMARDITLSAVDLEAIPTLVARVNDLAYTMQGEDGSTVAQARTYAQSYTSVFGREVPPSYIDLGSFVQLLEQQGVGGRAAQAGEAVLEALRGAVIAEKHGPGKPGSTGISIYFPNSTLYRSPVAGPQSYVAVASRFAEASLWDDFLAYHYSDRPFEPSTREGVTPPPGAAVRAPGAGEIQVSPITLSAQAAEPGQPVRLSTEIRGENIGYIYLFIGFYDEAANSIFVADTDYLESPESRQVGDLVYPQWSESGAFTMQFEWEATVFAITDGQTSAVALFAPQRYGASAEQAVYAVDGLYTFADTGETRYARLYFRDGALWQVFGFNGREPTGSPREVLPQSGDTFTVLEKWMDIDANGQVTQVVSQEGVTLTYGEASFRWEEVFAAPGEYLVGFLVEDLDGNTTPVYSRVTVR
jgi:hypothetical protein